MQTAFLAASAMILSVVLPMQHAQAAVSDTALCQGSYSVMLMTEEECRAYVRQVRTLRSQGQMHALEILERQHDEQLAERAARCPCMMGEEPENPPLPQLVMLESDC
jgi:uncharacterized membrane protein